MALIRALSGSSGGGGGYDLTALLNATTGKIWQGEVYKSGGATISVDKMPKQIIYSLATDASNARIYFYDVANSKLEMFDISNHTYSDVSSGASVLFPTVSSSSVSVVRYDSLAWSSAYGTVLIWY